MAKKISYFDHNSVGFKVFECYDLDNYDQTPKSSRVQKKLFADSNDTVLQEVSWSEARFTNRTFHINIDVNSTKTPPMIKTPFQPLAPTKPRRFTDKTELKPKKLVFKDVEESESDMVDLSVIYEAKTGETVLHDRQSSSLKQPTAAINKNDLRIKVNRRNINDNKENNMQYHYAYFDDKDLSGNNKCAVKKGALTQKKNSNKPGVIKHLRV
ncbi:Protein of unknown function [Cotesia congregata]|uniref:Uncharacterized protein n=1 Tax=Cotesia congregata TaxID=51543 RepID=A0A8J2EAK4_COTCN|nr:Protein of unknown function [Cotesia congregata]